MYLTAVRDFLLIEFVVVMFQAEEVKREPSKAAPRVAEVECKSKCNNWLLV